MLKTSDGGKHWETILPDSCGLPRENLIKVWFINEKEGFVVNAAGFIYQTNNGGKLWEKQGLIPKHSINRIHFTESSIFVITHDGFIFKTVDKGKSWKETTFEWKECLYDVHFVNSDTGFVVGRVGVFASTYNSGDNWKFSTIGANFPLHSVFFTDSKTGYAASYGDILKTTDGESWERIYSDAGKNFTDLVFLCKNSGFIIGKKGQILKTNDAGENWKSESAELDIPEEELLKISCIGNKCYIISNYTLLVRPLNDLCE